MNSRLKHRLERIEEATRRRTPPAECQSAVPYFESWLSARGIERGHSESMAETTARVMGISVRELRVELMRLASGP